MGAAAASSSVSFQVAYSRVARAGHSAGACQSRERGVELLQAAPGVGDERHGQMLRDVVARGVQRDQPQPLVAEHAPRARREVLQAGAHREDHVGVGRRGRSPTSSP